MGRLARFLIYVISLLFLPKNVTSIEILSKSKLEKCEKSTGSDDKLGCTTKIVINMAVPSGSSGGEASVVAEIVEVEQNSTNNMQTLRVPPVITVNKSASYALYELTYIRDVSYKPREFFAKTRKCQPDAGANVVKICERLRDEQGHVIENTRPICCPCGPRRRAPSSCGNIFDKLIKGKANTAHCLRFPGDWFHVFGIGQQSIGFSVRIEMKTGNKVSEVIVGPENRTATSADKFLRVNLIGDFVGYSSIPTFEDFYLVIPRQGGPGQPNGLGRNLSMWMLLERVRFTLDGVECNKIGVGYEAFNGQPNFCSAPFWSCLHNQLWNFWEADQNRIKRKQVPLYGVQGRFQRINEHPGAGSRSFSIGVTEVLNTNLLIELRADDIDFVFQRSPGKIMSVKVPTFEALTQFGVATIMVTNTGEVEASYSLTFDCSKGVALMEEQFFIMKPKEISSRSFKVYPTTDQAAKYVCYAILKDSEFSEVDRAECQFSTTAIVLDNGSQITPLQQPKIGVYGFFESLKKFWKNLWESLVDFITGETCRRKCSGLFDFSCHIQYICMSWILLFGLLLAIFMTVLVLLWLLHQKGFFDPLYDCFEDHFEFGDHGANDVRRHGINNCRYPIHGRKRVKTKHHKRDARYKRSGIHYDHRHNHSDREDDYHHYLHHVHKDKHKHKHRHVRSSSIIQEIQLDRRKHDDVGHHKHRRAPELIERPLKLR
ncbi:protein HAPLESS 2-like [Hibiscus syriacus]|uniref:protein HAPLESS 2-like n=1 Tax=Hibiscus syriacus TaxID=106335 RepID=UPI0019242E17|nr:protein HAPLESS 2-like [Hibiscus syriacus]